MKNITKNIIVVILVVFSFSGIWFFGELYSNDVNKNDSFIGTERATETGLSQRILYARMRSLE